MIGLDTGVLVRYLTQDDERQSTLATRLIESLTTEAPGFVSCVVLVEATWVLESCYAVARTALDERLENLLRTDSLRMERAELAWRALRRFTQNGGDYFDALIVELGLAAGSDVMYRFDQDAVKRFGTTLLQ